MLLFFGTGKKYTYLVNKIFINKDKIKTEILVAVVYICSVTEQVGLNLTCFRLFFSSFCILKYLLSEIDYTQFFCYFII